MNSNPRIQVINAIVDGLSGVMAWAFRLKKAMTDHDRYEIQLMGCREVKDSSAFDIYAPSLDTILNKLKENDPLIVIPNFMFDIFSLYPTFLKNNCRPYFIGYCRSDSDEEYYTPLSWYEPAIAHFIAVSPVCASELAKRLPHRTKDISTMPTGIDFTEHLSRTYATDPIRLIYAGRIEQRQKRIMDLIPLVRHLLNLKVDFTLSVYGGGKARHELEESINQMPHEGRVLFHGVKAYAEMPYIWNSHDVFIQVSEYEGTSNSMLEAMAQGAIPVVTQTKSGSAEIICNGTNGYCLPIGDMQAFAHTILSMSRSVEHLEKLGSAAHESARAFSISAYSDKLTAILDRILAQEPRPWPEGRPIIPPASFGLPVPQTIRNNSLLR